MSVWGHGVTVDSNERQEEDWVGVKGDTFIFRTVNLENCYRIKMLS